MANQADFTNNSGRTVTVISGMTESATSPKQGYEQTLQVLTFADGSKTLASGSSAKLNLPEGQVICNLLISDPATLSPIKAVGEGPDYTASGPWPKPNKAITVTADDLTAMNQALQFRQNIMTSPSSKMAEAFKAALQEAQKLGTADKILAAMAAYFQGYPTFSKVTYPAYSAVESYLKTFALSWVQPNDASKGNPGAVYYVYSEPDATKPGATSEGKIIATRKSGGSGNADPNDSLSGYTLSVIPNDGGNTALSYGGGIFEDSEGGAISLVASYAYKGTFTGKISDVQLWPVLIGTLLGKKVIAVPLEPESAIGKWWSSLSFTKVFGYFMEAMGLWMALDFLKTKLSSKEEALARDKANNEGDDPSSEQESSADSDSDSSGESFVEDSSQDGRLVSDDSDFEVSSTDEEINQSFSDTRSASSDALSEIAVDNTNGAIADTGETLENLAAIENTPAIEAAGQNLADAGEAVQNGDIATAETNIQSANTNLGTAVEELGDQITVEEKAQYEAEIAANQEAAEDAKETDEQGDESGEGNDPEGEGVPFEGIEA